MRFPEPEEQVVISQAMALDLMAAERGTPFRERTWRQRPWRRGERATVLMRDGSEFLATVTHYSFEKGLKLELDSDPDGQVEWLDIADMRPL